MALQTLGGRRSMLRGCIQDRQEKVLDGHGTCLALEWLSFRSWLHWP